MPLVVADTGPINYLVQIGESDLLRLLFLAVHVPEAVIDELRHPQAPDAVRRWAASPPGWVAVHHVAESRFAAFPRLGRGEQAALALVEAIGADFPLIDDRRGVATAAARGIRTFGTLRVLSRAAEQGHCDFRQALDGLLMTNFRVRPDVLAAIRRDFEAGT